MTQRINPCYCGECCLETIRLVYFILNRMYDVFLAMSKDRSFASNGLW